MSQNGPILEGATDERQPAFNAPWPALLLAAGLVALYVWQQRAPDQDGLFFRYGLIARTPDLEQRLFTSLFVHGGWAHVLLNALAALAFGSGVSRLFGTGPVGSVAFFVFYLLCGLLSGVGYLLWRPEAAVVLIGASGAIAGLMGAASRIVDGRRAGGGRRLAPFTSPTVISMGAAWLGLNLLIATLGFAPGMGSAAIAWEAHLVGYAAGLLLIGPVSALLRLR